MWTGSVAILLSLRPLGTNKCDLLYFHSSIIHSTYTEQKIVGAYFAMKTQRYFMLITFYSII